MLTVSAIEGDLIGRVWGEGEGAASVVLEWGSGKSTRGVNRWVGIGIKRGMTPVEFILFVVAAYVVVGVVFGVLFATMGVGKVDEAAAGARWLFRVFICLGRRRCGR